MSKMPDKENNELELLKARIEALENTKYTIDGVYGDFNKIIETGSYAFGGQNYPNRPSDWGVLEVRKTGGFVLQYMFGAEGKICVRYSYDIGQNWTAWKYTNLV